MDDCIFCKIISKQIPCDFVYEDDQCVAFNDLHPKAQTHLLIVPKKHIPTVADMKEEDSVLMGHLLLVAKKLGDSKKLSHYKLQFNVGKGSGQEVFHIHLHQTSSD